MQPGGLDMTEQLRHVLDVMLAILQPALWMLLCVGFVLASAHLLTMLGTRWGDRRVSPKALFFSVAIHLSLGVAVVAMIPEYRHHILSLGQEDPPPVTVELLAPVDPTEAYMGPAFAQWFASNGAQGTEPKDPNLLKIYDLFRSAAGQKAEERFKTAQEIWKILVDQQYSIGTVGQSPAFMGVRLASNKLGNIPSRVCIAQHCRAPAASHPEMWYFKQ